MIKDKAFATLLTRMDSGLDDADKQLDDSAEEEGDTTHDNRDHRDTIGSYVNQSIICNGSSILYK